MDSRHFRSWLTKQGCTFEPKKGGSGHVVVRRGNATSEPPMHGGSKQLGTGLINKIKKGPGPEVRDSDAGLPASSSAR